MFFANTLTQAISDLMVMHKSRHQTFLALILGAVHASNIHHTSLARYLPSPNCKAAERRTERFFSHQKLCAKAYAHIIKRLLNPQHPVIFCLDRTYWMFGKTNINLLILSIRLTSWLSLPLLIHNLDKPGNSNTDERVNLIQDFLTAWPLSSLAYLLGDREFVGQEWVKWLQQHNIPFCIRIKKNTLVSFGKTPIAVAAFFQHLPYTTSRVMHKEMEGVPLWISGTRSKKGDLVIVMSNRDLGSQQMLKLYRERWSIEEMFKHMKTAGFHIENTHMKEPRRLEMLMMLVGLAMLAAYAVGTFVKVRVKKTLGCPERSRFRAGLLKLQFLMSHSLQEAFDVLNACLNATHSMEFVKSDG